MTSVASQLLSAGSLTGTDICNDQDENLGDLKEIMLDAETGRIAYGVVSFGGFLGIGDKYFAVPWSAFHVDTDNKCLRLSIDKEAFDQGTGFDKDNWPNMADRQWGQRVHDQYQQTPYW